MKKNNKGFFLAETIVVIALVTTVMAFVYPNVSKLYETYQNRTYYYDQTEDIYALKAVYDYWSTHQGNLFAVKTTDTCDKLKEAMNYPASGGEVPMEAGAKNITGENLDSNSTYRIPTPSLAIDICTEKDWCLSKSYIVSYMASPTSTDYNFNRYLKSLKKTTYDVASYRLIGVFEKGDMKRYASIKIDNPNPNRLCNLGG